jgi:hypothetical protein
MKYLPAIFFFLMMSACRPKENIIKVELGRSGAWSDRGGAISIDSAHKFQFYGQTNFNDKSQYYCVGKVSLQQWKILLTKLDSIDFEHIDTTAGMYAADDSYFELLVEHFC